MQCPGDFLGWQEPGCTSAAESWKKE